MVDDMALLRRHAPVLRFDDRELFFPSSVDQYVEHSRFVDPSGYALDACNASELDSRWAPGSYLQFVSDQERHDARREAAAYRRRRFFSTRLGHVGLFGRLADAVFLLLVWLRPTVPRNTTVAAAIKANGLGIHLDPTCYGRVIRAGEWLVAHYAYFYAMNDWRSSYRGLNDHEGDWEQAWIFIDPQDLEPIWVATTNHEHRGPDMRRHWADPAMQRSGDRPVLYVAAGSHALLFEPGNFVTRVDIPGLRWLLRVQQFGRRLLRLEVAPSIEGLGPVLGVPFIDSAPGDGRVVRDWNLQPMSAAWLQQFRGLWGLDTGDPLQGERGPSGPKFDRRGEIRASWADPLGFAGLHGTPPPSAAAARVNRSKLEKVMREIDKNIRSKARLLPLAKQTRSTDEMADESERLTQLLRQHAELTDLRDQLDSGQVRQVGFREHLRNPARPLPAPRRGEWLLAGWAALTIPALVGALAAVLLVEEFRLVSLLLVVAAVVGPGDRLARRQVRHALGWLSMAIVVLAVATLLVVPLWSRSPEILGVALVAVAVSLLVANLSELRHYRAP